MNKTKAEIVTSGISDFYTDKDENFECQGYIAMENNNFSHKTINMYNLPSKKGFIKACRSLW